jgi:hypothetical protein
VKRATLLVCGLVIASSVACSSRVSLGELPADPIEAGQDADPTLPRDATSPPPDSGDVGVDSGALDGSAAPYVPCAQKTCGQSCVLCDPLDASCLETAVVKQCQGDGSCAASVPVCSYVPCAGKACGQSCRVCNPADLNCFETAVLKQCNVGGQCTSNPPGC